MRTAPGAKVGATTAVLRIDGNELESKPVTDKDIQITFTTELAVGTHTLSPIFQSAKGDVGAYYTIVRKK